MERRLGPIGPKPKKFWACFVLFWCLELMRNIVVERSTRIKVKPRLTQLGKHYKFLYNYSYINTTIVELKGNTNTLVFTK